MIRDISGRGPSTLRLTVSGIAMLAVMCLGIYLLMLRYTGYFADTVKVTAVMTSTGDGLPARADVKYRGVLVGSVKSVEIADKGAVQHVQLDLTPSRAEDIPVNVTARVIPNNLFGVTALQLVENGPAPLGLRTGAVIGEDKNGSVQLQTTLTTLRTVLDHIEPEKLGRVLGTLADALEPQYRVPGSTLDRLDRWLTTVDDIPGVGDLLGHLGTAAKGLTQSAPDLVSVLDQSVTTARTLTERRANLIAMLTTANGTIDTVNTLFARNPNSGKELAVGLDQMSGSLAADPDAIPESVANLNTALRRWVSVFHWGPQHLMAWSMHVSLLTPFRQYTAKDCPHYGDLYGPRCGGPSVPTVAPPQYIPPSWRDATAPAPTPAPTEPVKPGLPGLPALPAPAELFAKPAAAEELDPGSPKLRGPAEVAAIVGATPSSAQLLLLQPALTGTSVTVADAGGPR